ncbi:hypothetical protein SeLEV6574_g05335 [Synchytrium endobioticum]|uniref:Uncharacterized protein n=1 Tax=Synchytrium endobioticum TaxID=286115 RepID=A0A507CUR4_9FUNG|nr:hypothetical protein SeLEV6574_g05335 [Synchytrium endobioticum]
MKPNMMKKIIAIVVLQITILHYLVSAAAFYNGDATNAAAPAMVQPAGQAVDENLVARVIEQINLTMQLCGELDAPLGSEEVCKLECLNQLKNASQRITDVLNVLMNEQRERSAAFHRNLNGLINEQHEQITDVLNVLVKEQVQAWKWQDRHVAPDVLERLDNLYAQHRERSAAFDHNMDALVNEQVCKLGCLNQLKNAHEQITDMLAPAPARANSQGSTSRNLPGAVRIVCTTLLTAI